MKRFWTEPAELARLVECALEVDLHADVLAAAEHLSRIDPDRDRRYGLPSIVLARCGQFSGAEELLDRYASLYGETWHGLYARANVALAGNLRARGQDLLRSALRLDPDASGPLRRLTEDAARDGSEAVEAEIRSIASQKGGWRAKLLLAARFAEDSNEVVHLVRDAVEQSRDERDVLTYASSVLALRGRTGVIVSFIAPRFQLDRDRLECGVNLLYAFLTSGQKVKGESLLQRLEPMLQAGGMSEYTDFYRRAFQSLRDGVSESTGSPDMDLLKAMSAANRRGSAKTWQRCWALLAKSRLLVPVTRAWIEVSLFDSPWPDDSKQLDVVTGIDSEGREVVIAFTDERTLGAWGPMRSPCVPMEMPALLELIADANECALLINPAGPAATELALADIESWLDGSDPAGIASRIRFLAEPLRRSVPGGFIERACDFLGETGIVRQAWLFEMVDDRNGVNPAVAIDFDSEATPSMEREVVIDAADEVRWDGRRSRRVRFIPLAEGALADYLRTVGIRLPLPDDQSRARETSKSM